MIAPTEGHALGCRAAGKRPAAELLQLATQPAEWGSGVPLTRRRDPDRTNCRHVYYSGHIQGGTMGIQPEKRDQTATTAWKYRMWDEGCKLLTQTADDYARCFCGAEIKKCRYPPTLHPRPSYQGPSERMKYASACPYEGTQLPSSH